MKNVSVMNENCSRLYWGCAPKYVCVIALAVRDCVRTVPHLSCRVQGQIRRGAEGCSAQYALFPSIHLSGIRESLLLRLYRQSR